MKSGNNVSKIRSKERLTDGVIAAWMDGWMDGWRIVEVCLFGKKTENSTNNRGTTSWKLVCITAIFLRGRWE